MEIYGMLGEKLGTIGKDKAQDHGQPEEQKLPQWKQDFLQKPSISSRNGIAWGYGTPYEDTDTLVLTSTKSDFIDIRFPRKRELGKPIASEPSFWAFFGTSSTTFAGLDGDGIEMPYSAHCVWKHEIDSKGPGICDEGDMFLLPNGDCMEVGMMQNPQSGNLEMYKEYWISPDGAGGRELELFPCTVAKIIRMPNAKDHEGAAPSLQNGNGGTIIRIGNYCQGIARQPPAADAVLVERWTRGIFEAEADRNSSTTAGAEQPIAASTGWVQDWRNNTPSDTGVSMPCMWVCDDNRKLGDQIGVEGATWEVVEAVLKKR
ncbi:hypothetical protein A1O7_05486 [Cladophialophora yegresii CBS 114405]|uniref:Protein HRI1 n=1 Tax=Cladophialophora yegresii CBS 114405 TaxID=1182544 RepID=W9VR84_9EURO|nr:uncharacterized protein A1O7_05486 [Cladophialophora yegresii CBS 114405]EXJ58063.1 hypothetical protein A1O7_05486 [Cladophialophora yegresii CBS 114405]